MTIVVFVATGQQVVQVVDHGLDRIVVGTARCQAGHAQDFGQYLGFLFAQLDLVLSRAINQLLTQQMYLLQCAQCAVVLDLVGDLFSWAMTNCLTFWP